MRAGKFSSSEGHVDDVGAILVRSPKVGGRV